MNKDDELLAHLQEKISDAATRTDITSEPSPSARPPATPGVIAATEASLGSPLHPFLKRVYAEVADGGFGPGYGLLSLEPIEAGPDQRSLLSVYKDFRAGGWPESLLPLWDWGGAAWSCLDAGSHDGIIVTHDDVVGPTETAFTIRSWLKAWVTGVDLWKEIYEDKEATIINPFTKKPVTTKVRGRAKGKTWTAR